MTIWHYWIKLKDSTAAAAGIPAQRKSVTDFVPQSLRGKAAEDWLKHTKNIDTFHQWLFEWETIFPQFVPDQERAIIRLLSRINDEDLKEKDSISEDDQPRKI